MANNTIITIGRQYGSGGHDIGKQLAEELNVPFYDKALLERAAKDSGLCQEIFENHDEKPTNSFLYSLVMDTYSLGYTTSSFSEMPLNHKIFLAQFDAIKNIAKEGPCVIVGRALTMHWQISRMWSMYSCMLICRIASCGSRDVMI